MAYATTGSHRARAQSAVADGARARARKTDRTKSCTDVAGRLRSILEATLAATR
jgi:hypothetical protein